MVLFLCNDKFKTLQSVILQKSTKLRFRDSITSYSSDAKFEIPHIAIDLMMCLAQVPILL